jgi:hypothetical protein
MTEVTRFYVLAHIFISFTGALLLLAIWYNISKRFKTLLQESDSKKRVDKGLLYLSLAIFVWVLAGCWECLGNSASFSKTIADFIRSHDKQGNNFFSIANDLFLLLALFYSDYAPKFIYKNEKNIVKIIYVVVAMGLLTLFLPWLLTRIGEQNEMHGIIISAIPDLLLSGFLAVLLIISFYRTFAHRGLIIAAIISSIVIVFILISILPDVFPEVYDDFAKNLIKIIAKTSFIAITLVLATSWVIELANTPRPSEMMIKFMDWSLVKLTIPSKGVYDATIEFGSKTTQFTNLLKFAIRRKFGKEADESMEITHMSKEINNQSYLNRIVDNINEILHLEESQKLDRKDLLTFVGKAEYRLRIMPENILFDDKSLHEFLDKPENKFYKTLYTKSKSSKAEKSKAF